MGTGDDAIQEFTTETETADPLSVSLEAYDTERVRANQAEYDMFDGVTLSEEDIELFADVYGDDQDLHVGDEAARAALDDEYGIFDMFARAEEDVIVPGAQLFNLAMQELEDVESVYEASFEEPVYAGDTFRLQEQEDEDDGTRYVLETDDGSGYREAGTFHVEHGDANNAVFGTLIPAGMGFWDRTGDVLMGYEDVTVDDDVDMEETLTFTREATGGKEIPTGRLQQYRNSFEDGGGDALTYTETDLHL